MESSRTLSAPQEIHENELFDTPSGDILDVPSDLSFDRITALGARLFDAPICLIALTSEPRLWFTSKEELHDTDEVRAWCLSQPVLGAETVCWAPDTQRDAKLAAHPLVKGEFGLRFFAAAPLRASDGQPLGALAVIDHRPRPVYEKEKASLRDLAGMVEDELELRRQTRQRLENDAQFDDERYRDLFEMNPQPMWVFDAETLRYLAVNEAAILHYGYSREEFLSMTAADIRPPDALPSLLDNLKRKRHLVRECGRHCKKSGEIIEVEISSRSLQLAGRPARLVTAYDTTERERARHALQLRDRYLAALVGIQRELLRHQNTGGSLNAVLDMLGEVSNASRVYYLEHGKNAKGRQNIWVRASWRAPGVLQEGDERERWQALSHRLSPASDEKLRCGEAVPVEVSQLPEEERALFADYGVRAALFVPMLASGRFLGTLGFEHCGESQPWSQAEIHHLQAAAAALALALESEAAARALADERERLAVMLASVTEGVITTDLHAKVVLMNPVAEHLTGWTAAEALDQPIRDVFKAYAGETFAEAQPLEDSVTQALATGRTIERDHQVWLRSRDNVARRVAKSSAPVYDQRGQIIGAVKVFRDITAQEKIAEELLKASKLESIGTLAGGIAHDFNNILTAIIGNLSLAKLYNASHPRAVSKLESAERACFRARDLTNQLLTFAKGGSPIKTLAHLDEIIRESVRFALHGSPVHCHFDLPVDLWPVEADIGQIGQVFNNLAINAVQAMPKGGFIKVCAENILLDDGCCHLPSLTPGRYVKIAVEDDGMGIPMEHLNKIFDPFFSTKENGSGLGLATSYSIIKKHSGCLSVASVRGVGSTFYLYLPAVLRQPEIAPSEPLAIQPLQSKGGRVLIMDDEPAVLELAESMLAHLGYDAAVVRNGDAALDAYRQAREQGQPFDAVILDLTIPGGMGGEEAIGQLRQFDPAVKAIVSSGYSTNPTMSSHRERGFGGVLTKPYHLEEMAEALGRLLHPAAV